MTIDTLILIILAMFFVVALVIGCLTVASDSDDQMEAVDVKDFSTIPSPKMRIWVRYPVPLDDDLQQFVAEAGKTYGIDPALILAVIWRESDFDPDDISDDGKTFGLMGVMASEHTDRCMRLGVYNLRNPYQNIVAGTDILAELYADYGDWARVLSFYNGGGGELPWPYADAVLGQAEIYAEGAMTVTEVIRE